MPDMSSLYWAKSTCTSLTKAPIGSCGACSVRSELEQVSALQCGRLMHSALRCWVIGMAGVEMNFVPLAHPECGSVLPRMPFRASSTNSV